jgi:phosphatidylglycerol:prolipoprotein diacylglycerol transferase
VIIVGSILGARLLYVIISWRDYVQDPLAILRLWEGGLVFYGGFAAAALLGWWYLRHQHLSVTAMADLTAPYVPLGHALGRLGCFAQGCCYGTVSPRGGLVFPSLGDGLPHLPTQLYEAGFNLLLFLLLLSLRHGRRLAPGQLFWTYLALYAAGRFSLEFLRGDEIRGTVFWPWLHTSQAFAALGAVLAIGMLIYLGRRRLSPRG